MNDPNEKKGAPAHPTVEPPVPRVDTPHGNEPMETIPTKPAGVGDTDENPELKVRH